MILAASAGRLGAETQNVTVLSSNEKLHVAVLPRQEKPAGLKLELFTEVDLRWLDQIHNRT